MAKWYGNLTNRFEEGKNFNKDKQIHVGDPITMYYWSDRTCYYVTNVVDQKHIFVKRYQVCADHDKAGGVGSQDWKYFKTKREENDYLSKYFPDTYQENIEEDEPEEWVYRYNSWKQAYNYDKKFLDEQYSEMKEAAEYYNELNTLEDHYQRWVNANFTEKEQKKLKEGKTVTHYFNLDCPISFGVLNYHYDWEF